MHWFASAGCTSAWKGGKESFDILSWRSHLFRLQKSTAGQSYRHQATGDGFHISSQGWWWIIPLFTYVRSGELEGGGWWVVRDGGRLGAAAEDGYGFNYWESPHQMFPKTNVQKRSTAYVAHTEKDTHAYTKCEVCTVHIHQLISGLVSESFIWTRGLSIENKSNYV